MIDEKYKILMLPSARSDMESIVSQFAFLPSQSAKRCFNLLCTSIDGLSAAPERYPPLNIPSLACGGYRTMTVGGYLVIFAVAPGKVYVNRIIFEKDEYKKL